uniref:Uncharacterized protein n=1 Tax=Timema tahoe TaxID=61484 RepID=A0A7R9IQN7_9NEOP|nr:unnamed protein product [Timema tahoe]
MVRKLMRLITLVMVYGTSLLAGQKTTVKDSEYKTEMICSPVYINPVDVLNESPSLTHEEHSKTDVSNNDGSPDEHSQKIQVGKEGNSIHVVRIHVRYISFGVQYEDQYSPACVKTPRENIISISFRINTKPVMADTHPILHHVHNNRCLLSSIKPTSSRFAAKPSSKGSRRMRRDDFSDFSCGNTNSQNCSSYTSPRRKRENKEGSIEDQSSKGQYDQDNNFKINPGWLHTNKSRVESHGLESNLDSRVKAFHTAESSHRDN